MNEYSIFNSLEDFLEDLENSLEKSKTCLNAAIAFLGSNVDPRGNLRQAASAIKESQDDIANLRYNLPSMIDEAEDRDIAVAIQEYINGDL